MMPRKPNRSSQTEAAGDESLTDLLPDPVLLQYYRQFGENVVPDLLSEFREYGAHRRQFQLNRQKWDYDLQRREQLLQGWGQFFAFALSAGAIGGGLWLAQSHLITGAIISGGTVASIALAFIKTRVRP